MQTQFSSDVPDGTYFRTGDAEPSINEDGSIIILDGNGSSRSWGRPGVTSTVVYDDCDLIAVHIGFHHKHGGGQFWRYYTTDGTTTSETAWAKLPDETRQAILNAATKRAPSWARLPGKLRANYAKPASRKQTSYKLVRMDENRLVGLYDGSEYVIGKRLAESVSPKAGEIDWDGDRVHAGGYYSHPSPEQVETMWANGNLVPARCVQPGRYALIECQISGRIVRFPNGKMASTYLTPVRVLKTIEHA